jgi:hypothetical protein
MQSRHIDKVFRHMLSRSSLARKVARMMQCEPSERLQTLVLLRDSVWVSNACGRRRISVLAGQVWLTQEGIERDIFLACGQDHVSLEHGKIVLLAVELSVVRVEIAPMLPIACEEN